MGDTAPGRTDAGSADKAARSDRAAGLAGQDRRQGALWTLVENRFGHWRAGWRLAVYGVLTTILGLALAWPLGLVLPNGDGGLTSWSTVVAMGAPLLGLLLAGLATLRWIDRRPASMLGLGLEPGWRRELGLGLVAGVGLASLEAALLGLTGVVGYRVSGDPGGGLAALPRVALLFVLAGAVEELLFRGYPLQVLAEGTRRWLAALLLCALFAVGHLANPDQTPLATANIFLLGLLLAVLYFQTRRLWLPVALHASWNFAQSWVWGFDVSGITIEETLLVAVPRGARWLSGGGFGLEGSAVTTAVVVGVLAWLLPCRPLQPAKRVAERWAACPEGFGVPPRTWPGEPPPTGRDAGRRS